MAMRNRQKFGSYPQLRSTHADFLRPDQVQLYRPRFQVRLIAFCYLHINLNKKSRLSQLSKTAYSSDFEGILLFLLKIQTVSFIQVSGISLTQFLPQNKMDQEQLSIKQFTTIKELGSGSFGQVKLVQKVGTQILYALKTVKLNRLSQKEKENALNQVRLLASISIPTVVKYEGSFFNMETNELCVLMEYADGGDLQHMILDRENEKPGMGFEEKYVWKIAYQLLHGLKTLHKNNIIHRDIKSANIFFAKGVAKLGDLNVSKLTQDGFCSTQTGTPYYTSPEIWCGQKYGSKCDIWSLGCLIYELCAMKVPFKACDFPSLYRKITKGQYEELPQKYSTKLRRFVSMCLTVEEEMRPTAGQLLENSHFQSFDKESEDVRGGEINMMDTIRCPKVLKNLNARLPKAGVESSKKLVSFASKQFIEEDSHPAKQNRTLRKIRSQKVIKMCEDDNMKAPRGHHQVKLPRVDKQQTSEKVLVNGLCFSTKKLKSKPSSNKHIKDQPQSSKLIL